MERDAAMRQAVDAGGGWLDVSHPLLRTFRVGIATGIPRR